MGLGTPPPPFRTLFVYRSVGYFHFATIHGDGDQFHSKPIVAGTVAPATNYGPQVLPEHVRVLN